MGATPKASDLVTPYMKEAVKTYSAFDGSSRLEYHYTAHIDAEEGDQCMVTQYAYDGVSTRVQKTKEGLATWQAAWDI